MSNTVECAYEDFSVQVFQSLYLILLYFSVPLKKESTIDEPQADAKHGESLRLFQLFHVYFQFYFLLGFIIVHVAILRKTKIYVHYRENKHTRLNHRGSLCAL